MADYFVDLHRHLHHTDQAMSDACEEAMEKQGERVHHIEGHRGGTWLLMDFSSVVVHIFMDEARSSMTWSASGATRRRIPLEDG